MINKYLRVSIGRYRAYVQAQPAQAKPSKAERFERFKAELYELAGAYNQKINDLTTGNY